MISPSSFAGVITHLNLERRTSHESLPAKKAPLYRARFGLEAVDRGNCLSTRSLKPLKTLVPQALGETDFDFGTFLTVLENRTLVQAAATVERALRSYRTQRRIRRATLVYRLQERPFAELGHA